MGVIAHIAGCGMMEINKKELKIISYEFRCIANRVLGANYLEATSILKMFLRHIEANDLILDFVKSNIKGEVDIEADMNGVCSNYGAVFGTGETQQEEIAYTYHLIKYIVEKQKEYRDFTTGYSSSNHYQDMAKGFNTRVVLPFINSIEGYLTKISIQMGFDEEQKYMITINNTNGQVNISQDSSTLNAVQNLSLEKLDQLTQAVKESIGEDIGAADREVIVDSVDCLTEELRKPKPKRGLIQNCLDGLIKTADKIPAAIALCERVKTLVEYVKQSL